MSRLSACLGLDPAPEGEQGAVLAPLERPLRMRGWPGGAARLLSLAGDGAWGPAVRTPERHLTEGERAGC